MITKPLELSSHLKKRQHRFDFLFFINAGLIALFFSLFSSPFVLSPGLGIGFHLPTMKGAVATAAPTDVVIAVHRSDMALVDGAVLDFARLKVWLEEQARQAEHPRLLVQADRALSAGDLAEIYEMAMDAGFSSVQIAAEPSME